jgi:hypothetical protein
MPKKSGANKLVQFSAAELPERTSQDLDRLEAAMRIPVQPGEAEEGKNVGPRVRRGTSGDLPERPLGPVRRAILASLDRHNMTRYQLWKKARAHCHRLSASAVYDYLRGVRDIGVEYAEALMKAAKLKVVGSGKAKPKRPATRPLKRSPAR